MKNQGIIATTPANKTANIQRNSSSQLSDDAFYLMALTSLLKKTLGPASLQHFLATGETVVFTNKAVG